MYNWWYITHNLLYIDSDEAKCWCNKEFYDLLLNCTTCLSSPSVNATVYSLDEYKNDCKNYGTEFKEPKYKKYFLLFLKNFNRFLNEFFFFVIDNQVL